MHTWIYKGAKKAQTYLYVTARDDFSHVPTGLLQLLGKLQLVVDLDLHAEGRLAQADVGTVMQQLAQQKYYLQLPRAAATLRW